MEHEKNAASGVPEAYLRVEYRPENADAQDVYRWDDFLRIAGGGVEYAMSLADRCSWQHPETLLDEDLREGEAICVGGEYVLTDGPDSLEALARHLWDELGDVWIDDDERIGSDFHGFPAGTHREDIWHWFEDAFHEQGVTVHGLMFPEMDSARMAVEERSESPMSIDAGELDDAIVELEEMFGGYVGEGTYADEIRWVMENVSAERADAQRAKGLLAEYQAEMAGICRALGFEPDVQVSSPTYYGDAISERIDNLKATLAKNEEADGPAKDAPVAVRAGFSFNLFAPSEVAHIDLKEDGRSVTVDGTTYPLFCGSTFEESQKVDRLLDIRGEKNIGDYLDGKETKAAERGDLEHVGDEMADSRDAQSGGLPGSGKAPVL